jgi:anti-anti-sigma factor
MDSMVREAGKVRILECRGDITINGGDEDFRKAVQRLVDEGNLKIVANCKGVGFADSSGIGQLVSSRKKLLDLGGDIKIADPSRRLYEILGRFPQNFEIFKTEVEAVGSYV